MTGAFAYLRVSGKGQVNGDGFTRQRKAIEDYAKANRIEIVRYYRDEGVSGTLENRPALAEMMVDLEANGHGIKTVIVEKMDRIARDLMIQESIIQDFRESGISLISALEGADLLDNDPTRKLVRQVLGAIAEYEKSMLVQKLRVARQRKKGKGGKCEGRKSYAEAAPETVERIKQLRRKPKGGTQKSFREIAELLNGEGVATRNGQPWTLQTVRNALKP
ncbi:MAG: recombinase family protein [Thermodesulfobacteriota bacterium]